MEMQNQTNHLQNLPLLGLRRIYFFTIEKPSNQDLRTNINANTL